ncbi:MAG TPA: phage regulatory CII family protein [Rhizomicrobium sp.]|nr:phage regulatory CII family protein [Rhizomicrobium sp.]
MSLHFWEIARQLLVVEKVRPLGDVAQSVGMEYATLYSRVNGRTPFRLDEARALLVEVPDVRLADALLQGTSFMAVERLDELGWGKPTDAIESALQSAREMLEILTDINTATASRRLDKASRTHIEQHLHEAERALARLKLALPHLTVATAPAE